MSVSALRRTLSPLKSCITDLFFHNPLDINSLRENDLYNFYSYHDEIRAETSQRLDKPPKAFKANDFIHFIWMGNPLKKEYQNNILGWKKRHPQKEIILWVDKKALENRDLIDFAKQNNIKLIDLEKVFSEQNSFGLNEFIKLEKDRLPPNWGAVSDMYRYLILYYFGGVYSDTDIDIYLKLIKNEIDFDADMSFNNEFKFTNDILMTKNLREDFWHFVINQINYNYTHYDDNQNKLSYKYGSKHSRMKSTLNRTGPRLISECIDKSNLKNLKRVQFLNDSFIGNDNTWNGKLTDEKCKILASKKDIVERIINNIILELKEGDSLDLTKYDGIIAKIPDIRREDILEKVKSQITHLDEKSYRVENIFAKNSQEYEEFLSLIPKKCLNITSYNRAFRKSIQRKNHDMFKYLFDHYPNEIFFNNMLSKKMIAGVLKHHKSIFLSLLEQAKRNNTKIELDINTAIKFFKTLTEEEIDKYEPLTRNEFTNATVLQQCLQIEEKMLNQEELDIYLKQLAKLINIVPTKFLKLKDNFGRNILHMAVKYSNTKILETIKKALSEKGEEIVFNELLLTKDLQGMIPSEYSQDDAMKDLLLNLAS